MIELTDPAAETTFASALAMSRTLDQAIKLDPQSVKVSRGDRPTGPLHLGQYFGTLTNRVRLQEVGASVIVLIADYQVITDRECVSDIPSTVNYLVLNYIASGIDSDKTNIFANCAIRALNQIIIPFLSILTLSELQRNHAVKPEVDLMGERQINGLLLTYPIHQTADTLFAKVNTVPVGRDQLPRLEFTRAIACRFNQQYGNADPVLPEPIGFLSDTPLPMGLDARRASKSRSNSVSLKDTEDETAAIIKKARTYSLKYISVATNNCAEVSNLLTRGAPRAGVEPAQLAASTADRGSGILKPVVTESVNEFLQPIRRRRLSPQREPGLGGVMLAAGSSHAN